MPAPSSSDTYSNPFYAKQVSEWMSRAKPEDKARFERLFSALDPASPPERKKPPPPRPFTATGGYMAGVLHAFLTDLGSWYRPCHHISNRHVSLSLRLVSYIHNQGRPDSRACKVDKCDPSLSSGRRHAHNCTLSRGT